MWIRMEMLVENDETNRINNTNGITRLVGRDRLSIMVSGLLVEI